jgi:exopolysaccharide/PEP-CTERM locus tyrosine autokinase
MSIIERVAELLGPIAPPNPRHAPLGGADAAPKSGLFERAASQGNERSKVPEARPALPARTTARTLSIDLDRLRSQSILTPDAARTPIAEGFRRIKRRILANVANPKAGAFTNLVMVTSALTGEGKTFCAMNLAISIALEMDSTVLLVDADVAKPSIPQALGLKAESGLMDVLLDPRIDLADVLWKTTIDKLMLLPAGTTHQHATELLASEAMGTLLREMAARYRDRIIVFDSPPLLAASEASALANHMGQIVMIVEAGRTTERALKDAVSRIESSKVVGLVLNKGAGGSLGYGGGYGYYHASKEH